jgi:hypothetical protein
MLDRFQIDTRRDILVPDIELYQMDLSNAVAQSIESAELDENGMKLLPSWSKFAAHPVKSKGFFVRVIEAVFLGKHGLDELNSDLQTKQWTGNRESKVVMMFMPANTRQESLEAICSIAESTLPAWRIVGLGGSIRVGGKRVTNHEAESIVKEQLELATKNKQPMLIISAQIAQRSFSIPEITELYLAYDAGESGATIQKMSRVLTPGNPGKIGRIVSLSFDPNRDDKFDTMVLETAINLRARTVRKSVVEAMQDVLRTINIFKCTPTGALPLSVDNYLEEIMARKSVSRVIGKTADISKLTDDEMIALASGNDDYFKNRIVDAVDKGKIRNSKSKMPTASEKDKSAEKLIAKAREVITAIVENMDIIIYGTECKNLQDSLAVIAKDASMQRAIKEEFNVEFETIERLLTAGVIKKEWMELLYDTCEQN